MKKRQTNKILKRAGIKLHLGMRLKWLPALEREVCLKKFESDVQKRIRSEIDNASIGYSEAERMNKIREIAYDVARIDNLTGVTVEMLLKKKKYKKQYDHVYGVVKSQ